MKILCIGDIVSRMGRQAVADWLGEIRKEYNIDFVIANGENLSHGNGISRKNYLEMSDCGINAFTLGNHCWGNKDVVNLLKYEKNIIRPANFDRSCAGFGSCIAECEKGRIGIINLIGRVFMPAPADSPFRAADREIERLKKQTDIILVDIHAEATSEKQAVGWYCDGRVSAVFGTHTHVQTADEMIMPKGTGYISDIGMTGAVYSILGMDRKSAIDRFVTGVQNRLEVADGKYRLSGAVFDIDENGKCVDIERVNRIQEG